MRTVRFSTAVESGRIRIIEPTLETIDEVKASATSAGDSFYLSKTDLQVLALALEFKRRGYDPQIVTDDYSIQNIAKKLEPAVRLHDNIWHSPFSHLDQILPCMPQKIPR